MLEKLTSKQEELMYAVRDEYINEHLKFREIPETKCKEFVKCDSAQKRMSKLEKKTAIEKTIKEEQKSQLNIFSSYGKIKCP